jgi:hypothetical protein
MKQFSTEGLWKRMARISLLGAFTLTACAGTAHGQDAGRAVEERCTSSATSEGEGTSNVNAVRRTNTAVAINIGSPGSSRVASATQSVRIEQNGTVTCEVSEITVDGSRP